MLIDITGPRNRLTVEQNEKFLTKRNLVAGDKRSYDINRATVVTLASGNAADITWFGKKYQGAGVGKGPLTLRFHPDGRVDVLKGRSPHFGAGRSL